MPSSCLGCVGLCPFTPYFCYYLCIMIDLYTAIDLMREYSKKNISFSFTFMSCNLSAGKSEGVVEVHHARLLKRESEKYHKHAEMVEKYLNLDTMTSRHFYQPLLMTLNGEKVLLQ